MKVWDKEDVFDNEIAPLMQQIIEVCREHKIPLVAVFQYANRDEGPCFSHTKDTLTGTAASEMRSLDRLHSVLFLAPLGAKREGD